MAELAAIGASLYVLAKNNAMVDVDSVMIQSDCLNALNIVIGKVEPAEESAHVDGAAIIAIKRKLTDDEQYIVDMIQSVVNSHGLALMLRHVRGHQTDHSGRSWVNNECDRLAKSYMRKARSKSRSATKRRRVLHSD